MKSLNEIGIKHGTDKSSIVHNYLDAYEKHLSKYKDKSFTLVEVGIGGDEYTNKGGESLKMWNEYFPNATIVGIDLFDKSALNSGRIHTEICDQNDSDGLINILKLYPNPDIIIDDASHVHPYTINTFETLFPILNSGGTYIIEDTHTFAWSGWKGSINTASLKEVTIFTYIFDLVYGMHEKWLNDPHAHNPNIYTGNPLSKTIESIYFYHCTIIITKK